MNQDKRLQLRISETDLIAWKRRSNQAGKELSEWIRERCNAEEGTNSGMRAAEDASVLGRSTLSGGGPAEPAKPRARKSEFAEAIAERTKHVVGCACFDCVQTERFFKAMRKEA